MGFGGFFWTGLLVLSTLAVIVQLACFFNDQAAAEAQHPLWDEKMANWNRLFYCPRCDHAFDPVTRKSAAVGSIKALL